MKKIVFVAIGLILLFIVLINLAIAVFNGLSAWGGIGIGVVTVLLFIYILITVITKSVKGK